MSPEEEGDEGEDDAVVERSAEELGPVAASETRRGGVMCECGDARVRRKNRGEEEREKQRTVRWR